MTDTAESFTGRSIFFEQRKRFTIGVFHIPFDNPVDACSANPGVTPMGQGNSLAQRGFEDGLICFDDELFAAVLYLYLIALLIHRSKSLNHILREG